MTEKRAKWWTGVPSSVSILELEIDPAAGYDEGC